MARVCSGGSRGRDQTRCVRGSSAAAGRSIPPSSQFSAERRRELVAEPPDLPVGELDLGGGEAVLALAVDLDEAPDLVAGHEGEHHERAEPELVQQRRLGRIRLRVRQPHHARLPRLEHRLRLGVVGDQIAHPELEGAGALHVLRDLDEDVAQRARDHAAVGVERARELARPAAEEIEGAEVGHPLNLTCASAAS